MNSRIQYLIQNPFEVHLQDVSLIQDEIEKYPYFSTLRNLLLFAMKEYQHESFHSELKKTSIYSPSRVALYHYLQKESQKPAEEPALQPITESNLITEERILPADEQAEIQANHADKETEPFVSNPTEEQTVVAENKNESTKVLENQDSAYKTVERSFSEWLTLTKTKETKQAEKTTEKDIKFKLIDEFIEKSPKIQPIDKERKTEQESTVRNLSTEYSDLMTETLAQIYVKQKKYDKALTAYKILGLKYPEKKSFFLEQIQLIEDLMKSK